MVQCLKILMSVVVALGLAAPAIAQPAYVEDGEAFAAALEALLGDTAALETAVEVLRASDKAARRAAVADVLAGYLSDPAGAPVFPPEAVEYFEREVRPILAERCYSCHGPNMQHNGLRLDARAAVLAGGDRGPAAVPGDPGASRMIQAIKRQGELAMPPREALADSEVAALEQWIQMGMPWPAEPAPARPLSFDDWIAEMRDEHWAFQPVVKPEAPAALGASGNPIDAFVHARLAESGLEPSPPADARTLIRRASYGLTGLPPTAEEIRAFEADASPEAFASFIDGLLESPRYGERWARYWLDVARYADTKGYVFEEERAYPFSHTYRDYVIRAFNEDKPYDRFIIEQIAADHLDLSEDNSPLAATGFLTVGRRFINNIHDITDDRIDVVTRGFLGLTVSCARCHDHKYDPVSAADYYALYGVFRSTIEPGELPLIGEPNPDDPQYQDFQAQLAAREADLRTYRDARLREEMTLAREKLGVYLEAAHAVQGVTDRETVQQVAKDLGVHWQLVERWRDYIAKKLEGDDPVFDPWKAFAALEEGEFAERAAALAPQFADNASINPRVARIFADNPPASMNDVAQRYTALLREADKAWTDLLSANARMAQANGDSSVAVPEALDDVHLEALRQVVYGDDSPATIKQGDIESLNDIPQRNRVTQLRLALDRVHATHPGRPDRAMAVADAAQLFDPYVYLRGRPGNRGDEVPRRYLTVLARHGEPAPFEHGSGRLELAEAIASRDNPLTARVMVNRIWMYHFGRPLVDTPSDFGLRSEPPSHPELLDYLAWRFMEDGWSMKSVHRLILTSSTYQQSSAAREEGLRVDPENKLLWRQNRQRLDFEAMRDTLLAVTGKLDFTMGGPSVDITQPPYSPRRTVYAHVERQNLPGIFRTFDFASPDTHSPRRFLTTVPQQALFLMNSEFIAQQARHLVARVVDGEALDDATIVSLYEQVLQRAPEPEEIALARRFMDEVRNASEMTAAVWHYGYGTIEPDTGVLSSFTALPHFSEGTWRGGANHPDPGLSWTSLSARGGHPGNSADLAVVRRWVAPFTGSVRIAGELSHGSEHGDGVYGYIIANGNDVVWRGHAHNSSASATATDITVAAGDTLDFVVFCGENEGYDSFGWVPRIERADGPGGRWHAAEDFRGPAPAPLTPQERYAQVLLLTNELMFVD